MKENIYLRFGNRTEEIEFISFPGGEVGVRIPYGSMYPERITSVEGAAVGYYGAYSCVLRDSQVLSKATLASVRTNVTESLAA